MSPKLNRQMMGEFVFVDGGRTFACCVESAARSRPEAWWWFRVSSEASARYAPFRAAPDDTPESVQPRIVRFYDDLLARRAAPAQPYWRRGAGAKAGAAATAVPAADVPSAEAAG